MFDFENAGTFDPLASSLLPVGDHLVTIDKVTAGKNQNGNLELVVEASNSLGKRTDWIYYGSEFGQSKVVALCVATGVPTPKDGDWDSEGILTQHYCNRFMGHQAGMVVRDELYQGKASPRVRGWVHPSQINSDIPAEMPVLAGVTDDDDIPF